MTPIRRHQRLLAHIAILAMLALAVWPTLLRVMAWSQAQPSYLSVLCSAALKASPSSATQAPKPDAAPAHAALDHCPLCALSHAMAPPPVHQVAVFWPLRHEPPRLAAPAQRPSAQKLSHRPRGPPNALA